MSKPQNHCFRAVEFTPTEDSDGRTLEGYAAVFDAPTQIQEYAGRFHEQVSRGAFAKTLSERTPVLQFDHGRDARTGSVPIGKIIDAREDEKGLFIKARMFDNATVEPIRQAIEGGAIDGMSFRFRVTRDEWHDERGNQLRGADLDDALAADTMPSRTIREVELYEAGPVVFPAYESTSVGVRSLLLGLSAEERDDLLEELIGRADAKKKSSKKPPFGKDDEDEDKDEETPAKGKGPAKKTSPSDDEDEEDEDTPKGKGKKPAPKKKPMSSSDSGLTMEARERTLFML